MAEKGLSHSFKRNSALGMCFTQKQQVLPNSLNLQYYCTLMVDGWYDKCIFSSPSYHVIDCGKTLSSEYQYIYMGRPLPLGTSYIHWFLKQ